MYRRIERQGGGSKMTDIREKSTRIEESQVAVAGDGAKVSGGVHYHISHLVSPASIIGFIAFASIATFVIVLLYMDKNPETKPKNLMEGLIVVCVAALVAIAFLLALSKVYKSVTARVFFMLVVPMLGLIGIATPLFAAAWVLDTSVGDVLDVIMTPAKTIDVPPPKSPTPPLPDTGSAIPANPAEPERPQDPQTPQPGKVVQHPDGAGIDRPTGPIAPSSDDVATFPGRIGENASTSPYRYISNDFKTASLGMEFVWIPPGTFMMGSPETEEGRYSRELLHEVTLSKGFYMQTTEVTQGQWTAVMGHNPSHFTGCGLDCPVESVSWNDVQEFIRRLNENSEGEYYRLPKEAEWEYACRAGTSSRFNTGDSESDLDRAGWYRKNSGLKTHPVGLKEPNDWGLYDMHGNVWEWCRDWYGAYSEYPIIDPTGPTNGALRVIRGGAWSSPAGSCRTAYRGRLDPDYRHHGLGFRLVRLPGQPGEPSQSSKPSKAAEGGID
jgi:formylglycine-generating enzyme required for sulfatase activity